MARDITARKQLESRLKEEIETLETLYRFGQKLASELDLETLVHELRQMVPDYTPSEVLLQRIVSRDLMRG